MAGDVAGGIGTNSAIGSAYGNEMLWVRLWLSVALAVAHGGVVVTEFAGIGAAADLLGISRLFAVPLSALSLWSLVLFGSYARAERIFLFMTLAFLSYPAAPILAHPVWPEVVHGALVPTLRNDSQYRLLLVAMIGTTITPYQQLFQQRAVVERGVARRKYAAERVDAYTGAVLGNVIWARVIIATGATLHVPVSRTSRRHRTQPRRSVR